MAEGFPSEEWRRHAGGRRGRWGPAGTAAPADSAVQGGLGGLELPFLPGGPPVRLEMGSPRAKVAGVTPSAVLVVSRDAGWPRRTDAGMGFCEVMPSPVGCTAKRR